jgi:hypothetical protein
LNQPLSEIGQQPIISERAPTGNDKAELGTIWVDKPNNAFYVLTSIVANAANWEGAGGGAGDFTSLTVNPGNITATAGDIIATAGDLVATAGDIIATVGQIEAAAGDIVAVQGDIEATAGDIVGVGVFATGDSAGSAATTSFTNVVDATQGVGEMVILSTNGNAGNNAGYLKFYVGTTPVYVPYFDDIAP